MQSFDARHQSNLRRLWLVGDVHGEFDHIARALQVALNASRPLPAWLVFLGDIELEQQAFQDALAPLREVSPASQIAYIHGNHDADSHSHWNHLHDGGGALDLHGRVADLSGVRVAGLGGVFMGRVWMPPMEPVFRNKVEAMNRGEFQIRNGQRPSSKYHAAIYPDDVNLLASKRADILVTHEAPSSHLFGFAPLDELARSMGAVRTFHGHQHDDRSDEYAMVRERLGFDARAVAFRSIKNGLGEMIYEHGSRA
jgi:hypothetical protein